MNTIATARAALFDEVLACEETLPAAFAPGTPDAAVLRSHFARGEALLRALAVVEDGTRHDEGEAHEESALQRIAAKLDLLTALVATLAGAHVTDPPRALEWSGLGAMIAVDAPLPVGTTGLIRFQPADWLPSPLVLPAVVIASDAQVVCVRFQSLPPTLEAALERHLFRKHRRAVAQARRRP